MQTGYAVQKMDDRHRPCFAEDFPMRAGESMRKCRARASAWAADNGGVVWPTGILNDSEVHMELKWMQEEAA